MARAKTADVAATSGEASDTQEEKHAGLVPVVVTTEHRGVFFGYVDQASFETHVKTVQMQSVRVVTVWTKEMHGFLGLTVIGPSGSCHVSPGCIEGKIHDVTGVWRCTPQAVKAWEAEPWGR